MNECDLLADENSTVCFDSLISDSRCPVNGVCVWAGVAIATFSLHKKEDVVFFTLATNKFSHFSNDTTIGKIKISLQDITPYPNATQPFAAPITAVIKIN